MADQSFTVNCGFFNSLNQDRLYNANQMNKPYRRLVSNGVFATPQGQPSTDLQVLSENSGMRIGVSIGEGIFSDKWFENTTKIVITVPNNTSLLPRRDSVLVQIDETENGREGRIVYRTGTPAANPLPPNINTIDDVHEYRIANIYVASGASNINQDAIVDLRGSSECPWITHLLYQVDTSTLFLQWQNAYQNYYNRETERFNAFMESLTEELTVTTSIVKLENHYITPSDNTTEIPINIVNYNVEADVLIVRVNNLFVTEGTDYTIAIDGSKITLTKDLDANQRVDFLILHSMIIGDAESVAQSISDLNEAVALLSSDTDWVNFTLENGATAYSAALTPAYRKYGKEIYLRGCIKNITTVGTVFATLPENFRPTMTRYYTIATGSITATIEIGTNGQLKVANVIGSLTANSLIPIDTQFITG